MSKHHHDEPSELHFEQVQHHGVQYEDRDLGARGIIVFLVVLCVFGFLICAMVWGYFDYHARQLKAIPPVTGPQVVTTPNTEMQDPTVRFPKPALQTDDVADMNNLRNENNAELESYGYVDQKAGVAHIPIDQAMDQLVKQGVPARPAAPAAPAADFGSGRGTVAGAGGGVRPANN